MKTEQDPSTATVWLLLAGISVFIGLMGAVRLVAGSSAGLAIIAGAAFMFITALRGRPRA